MKTDTLILVVDDQLDLQDYIIYCLEDEGYRVLTANDGYEALVVLRVQPIDLILADIAMPRMNGYQLYAQIAKNPQWAAIPFLFLTARSLDSDIRYGKELGVDDYLIKPIEPEDLLATVRGKLRRSQQLTKLKTYWAPSPGLTLDAFALGPLRINLKRHQVWLNDKQVKVSAREFTLLNCLAKQANQVVSLQTLVQATHNLEAGGLEAGSLLRPLIRSLRRKLGYPAGKMECIKNVRGVGYKLVLPPE